MAVRPVTQQGFSANWLGELQERFSPAALAKILVVLGQLAMLVLIIRQFQTESQMFRDQIAGILLAGFAINYFLPRRLRLPFFALLSLYAIRSVFIWPGEAWLVGIGIGLIVICHLPVPFWARVGLLLGVAVGLGLSRAEVVSTPVPAAVWPILGSMFMFRLIVYMYDLHHKKAPFDIWGSASYFFMLPNVVFPLFPVVDYSTFRRTHYDGDQFSIYQKGIQWMFRGVVQLILYRFVYYYGVIAPTEVATGIDLGRYLLATFLLYLRVSGSFHLIVGMLHLFGFNLPETNHRYPLSSSFTDLWRRINIYWKDFMMKVFYYPAYFRLRKRGETFALITATLFVFVVTWALHSYQWFWVRGAFLLSGVDILFWSILGVLVVASVLYESKYGRSRSLKKTWDTRRLAVNAVKVVGTLTVLLLLWSLWNAASFAEWLSLFDFSKGSATAGLGLLPGFLLVATVWMVLSPAGGAKGSASTPAIEPSPQAGFFRTAALSGLAILLLYLVGHPRVHSHFPETVQKVIRDLRVSGLNRQDTALMQRGYYEDLTRVERFNTQLWELYMKRQADWQHIGETEAARATGDFLLMELRPLSGILFHGAPLRTNRWGMRDRDYERVKPPNTFRIAMLGASHEMGSGVADDETFEALLEARLNRVGGTYSRYEILNFAVASYTPPQAVWVLEKKVPEFSPDAVLLFAHPSDRQFAVRHLADVARQGIEIPYPALREIAQKANLSPSLPAEVAEKNLTPYAMDIVSWTYRTFAQEVREQGALPIWVLLGAPESNPQAENKDQLIATARDAGLVVIDLSDVFAGMDWDQLRVAEWDWHPNARGHRIIADALYEALRNSGPAIPLHLNPD